MSTSYRKRRRARAGCEHSSVTRTENAGIGRTVCDDCGHVSVEFAKATFAADANQSPLVATG